MLRRVSMKITISLSREGGQSVRLPALFICDSILILRGFFTIPCVHNLCAGARLLMRLLSLQSNLPVLNKIPERTLCFIHIAAVSTLPPQLAYLRCLMRCMRRSLGALSSMVKANRCRNSLHHPDTSPAITKEPLSYISASSNASPSFRGRNYE